MKNIFLISIFIFTFSVIFAPNLCLASSGDTDGGGEGEVTLVNPLGDDVNSANTVIANIINAVLGVVGSLALVMFVFGGLTWMTAAGNNERVEKGKNILIWATIGLVIIFASYALVEFVIRGITGI